MILNIIILDMTEDTDWVCRPISAFNVAKKNGSLFFDTTRPNLVVPDLARKITKPQHVLVVQQYMTIYGIQIHKRASMRYLDSNKEQKRISHHYKTEKL